MTQAFSLAAANLLELDASECPLLDAVDVCSAAARHRYARTFPERPRTRAVVTADLSHIQGIRRSSGDPLKTNFETMLKAHGFRPVRWAERVERRDAFYARFWLEDAAATLARTRRRFYVKNSTFGVFVGESG